MVFFSLWCYLSHNAVLCIYCLSIVTVIYVLHLTFALVLKLGKCCGLSVLLCHICVFSNHEISKIVNKLLSSYVFWHQLSSIVDVVMLCLCFDAQLYTPDKQHLVKKLTRQCYCYGGAVAVLGLGRVGRGLPTHSTDLPIKNCGLP